MSADYYTEEAHQSWGGNIIGALSGALVGILLFLSSFGVLWMNEGRTNWAKVADTSTPLSASAVSPSAEGKFIAATGSLVSSDQVGDPTYLQSGSYIQLERYAEMYAWEEDRDTRTRKSNGSRTTTTYHYRKIWTTSPENSSSFHQTEGHHNPTKSIDNELWTVPSASVGAYRVEPGQLELPAKMVIALSPDLVMPDQRQHLNGNYLFIGRGTLGSPEIGDIRISYRAVPNNMQVTAFGTQRGGTLVPYMHRGKDRFYRALAGERSTAIGALQHEHNLWAWMLRGLGFMLMWVGLGMLFGPISAFLDLVPLVGDMARWAINALLGAVAFGLSCVTIFVAFIAHNPLALLLSLLAIGGGLALWGFFLSRVAPARA